VDVLFHVLMMMLSCLNWTGCSVDGMLRWCYVNVLLPSPVSPVLAPGRPFYLQLLVSSWQWLRILGVRVSELRWGQALVDGVVLRWSYLAIVVAGSPAVVSSF